MPRRHDEYPEDSEVGNPRVVHNHYSQQKNGNGTGSTNVLLGLCGALLLILVAITGFMWKSQIDFQSMVIDRLARVETRLGLETQP